MIIETSVIILTFHRPNDALSAVRSVLRQTNAPTFEIILMDNDKDASAKTAAEILAQEAQALNINFIYAIEPNAGVANARNSAVKLANGKYIAFLDDDEVAFENWLCELDKAQKQTDAEVVFGPIEARFQHGSEEPLEYFKAFFSRISDAETGFIKKVYGCGNSYIKKSILDEMPLPFNPVTNETGGEDDYLWADIAQRNGRFAWSKNAWVYEDVPKARATWDYLRRRAMGFGHHTSAQYFVSEHPNYVFGVFSMIYGFTQMCGMAGIAAILRIIGNKKWAWAYDKMARGMGKAFWFGPFRQKFYGSKVKKLI